MNSSSPSPSGKTYINKMVGVLQAFLSNNNGRSCNSEWSPSIVFFLLTFWKIVIYSIYNIYKIYFKISVRQTFLLNNNTLENTDSAINRNCTVCFGCVEIFYFYLYFCAEFKYKKLPWCLLTSLAYTISKCWVFVTILSTSKILISFSSFKGKQLFI